MSFIRTTRSLASFRRVPTRIVIGTAAASILMAVGMVMQNQPLYLVALFALLPWVPILLFESLWKVENYSWVAIFAVFVVLQVGHLVEHVARVSQWAVLEGTLDCPPPVDDSANAQRAVEVGLRSPDSTPTNLSSVYVIRPDRDGIPFIDSNGRTVVGSAACGVFGQLDIEIAHLVFELFGWVFTGILLIQFPHNRWLWVAMFVLIIHTIEYLFISYTYFLDPETVFAGTRQLWATVADGNLITAHPVGKAPAAVNFYEVAGKFGIVAKNGLIGTFIPSINAYLPDRTYLHFWYNFFVTLPTVIGFLVVARQVYDKYLAKALPNLTRRELVSVTAQLEPEHFKTGEVIVKQGDKGDDFYIISKGAVEVIEESPQGERVLATLKAGQYFGEIALRKDQVRNATVRALSPVDVLKLDHREFDDLVAKSDLSREQIDREIRRRISTVYEKYLMRALPTLSDAELHDVIAKADVEQYKGGDVVIKQGDIGEFFYIISKGEVDVIEESAGGDRILARLRAGDYFGEIALRKDQRRIATVRAATALEVLKLEQHEFQDLIDHSALSREQIDAMINRRVSQIVNKVTQ